MKLNKQQYEMLYKVAGKAEEYAKLLDKTVDEVVEYASVASTWLEQYAENLRTEADKHATGAVWDSVTDKAEQSAVDPNKYRINIKDMSPEEIVEQVREVLNRHMKKQAKQAGTPMNTVDDFLDSLFKEDKNKGEE